MGIGYEEKNDDHVVMPASTGGAHRLHGPSSAVSSRAAVIAVAAGAAVSAGSIASSASAVVDGNVRLLANAEPTTQAVSSDAAASYELQIAPSAPSTPTINVADTQARLAHQVAHAAELALERAEADEISRRPAVSLPARGTFTSGFGPRWGTFHWGIDIANSVGTTIAAAQDGEVIDAGPAQGFGNWVRIKSDDGTITVYGHMETLEVEVGQRVVSGQRIAGMGNRGFSTGPHLHFEVWTDGGQNRIDPRTWLAEYGYFFDLNGEV